MRLRLAVIIPTYNRRYELERLIDSIVLQGVIPDRIVVCDASEQANDSIVKKYPSLPITYIHTEVPSSTQQRNIAIKSLEKKCELITVFDDDIVLMPDAFKNMLMFWDKAEETLGGAVFNIINDKRVSRWVIFKMVFRTGAKARGVVLRSGYATSICPADVNRYVEWLFGGATVWRREVFNTTQYDEWFSDYGLGEDLDFSFRVGKMYKLAVVGGAHVQHLHAKSYRINYELFGKKQIVNTYYIVKKDRYFSKMLFYWACIGVMLENSMGIFLSANKVKSMQMLIGNAKGICDMIIGKA